MLLATCACSHISHTKRPHTHMHAFHCPIPLLYMHSALVPQVRMLHVRLGGPAQEVWRSSGAGEAISSPKRSKELRAAVRAEEKGWWWGGGRCSQQKGIPRMLSFNLESASVFFFFFLPQLYLTSSGFSVTMTKGRRVLDGLKMQSSWFKCRA